MTRAVTPADRCPICRLHVGEVGHPLPGNSTAIVGPCEACEDDYRAKYSRNGARLADPFVRSAWAGQRAWEFALAEFDQQLASAKAALVPGAPGGGFRPARALQQRKKR